MHKNPGFVNEEKMVHFLNKRPYRKLKNNLKHIVQELFGVVDEDEMIYAGKVEEHNVKPDIYVEVKGKRKYISLKSGNALKVSEENLKSYVHYLRAQGISEQSIKTIVFFHFGDGTLSGTGAKRYTHVEILYKLQDRIKLLNDELNQNLDFVINFVIRAMFKGTKEDNIEADCIYFGNVEYGILCSKEQIKKYIQRNNFSYLDCPHVGPLLFRPHARYVNKEITSEKKRMTVDIYWPQLYNSLTFISSRYDG